MKTFGQCQNCKCWHLNSCISFINQNRKNIFFAKRNSKMLFHMFIALCQVIFIFWCIFPSLFWSTFLLSTHYLHREQWSREWSVVMFGTTCKATNAKIYMFSACHWVAFMSFNLTSWTHTRCFLLYSRASHKRNLRIHQSLPHCQFKGLVKKTVSWTVHLFICWHLLLFYSDNMHY